VFLVFQLSKVFGDTPGSWITKVHALFFQLKISDMFTKKTVSILLALLALLLLIAFIKGKSWKKNQNECSYNKLVMNAYQVGNDSLIDSKTIEACWIKHEPDDLGLIKIDSKESDFRVFYYKENDPGVIKMLDFQEGDSEPSRWRANEGHDLFIVNKLDTLGFVFGDRKKSFVKGTIVFINGD
jgi:hypothetical protein